jgi:hypothetical protein
MNRTRLALLLFDGLALICSLVHHKEHTGYKVIDTGSLGGPNSYSGSPVVRCVAVWRRTS